MCVGYFSLFSILSKSSYLTNGFQLPRSTVLKTCAEPTALNTIPLKWKSSWAVLYLNIISYGFPASSKESACQCRRCKRCKIAGPGRSPGVGNGNSLLCSCLKNPMDWGAWQAIQSMGVQRVRHHWATEHIVSHELFLTAKHKCSKYIGSHNTKETWFIWKLKCEVLSHPYTVELERYGDNK